MMKNDIRCLDELKTENNPCKIRGIPLGWEPRQKLGIILEEEQDFP